MSVQILPLLLVKAPDNRAFTLSYLGLRPCGMTTAWQVYLVHSTEPVSPDLS